MAWRHPGFSAHIGETIPFEDKKAVEDVACYVVRSALSLKKLVYLDGQKAVLYRSRMNPSLGRNFEAMDPLEWLARMTDHIPDAGRHRTHFYGFYASRVRAERRETEPAENSTLHGHLRSRHSPRKGGRVSVTRGWAMSTSTPDSCGAPDSRQPRRSFLLLTVAPRKA